MKVFICWSGGLSQAIARELRDWLPEVIQSVEPFFSDEDITAGTMWFQEIDEQIRDTYFGILCMTATNKRSHWMHYEAGGLRKGIGDAKIVPLRIDIEAVDLEQPLATFQHVGCDKEGVKRLLDSINNATGDKKLSDTRLQRAFDNHWQAFSDAVEGHMNAFDTEEEGEPERTSDDKIDELLVLVRESKKEEVVHPATLRLDDILAAQNAGQPYTPTHNTLAQILKIVKAGSKPEPWSAKSVMEFNEDEGKEPGE